MTQIRVLIICEDIFVANLVLQYRLPKQNRKELSRRKDRTKKGSIITYLIEPCYLFSSSSQTICNTEFAPLSWNVLTNLKGQNEDTGILEKIFLTRYLKQTTAFSKLNTVSISVPRI